MTPDPSSRVKGLVGTAYVGTAYVHRTITCTRTEDAESLQWKRLTLNALTPHMH